MLPHDEITEHIRLQVEVVDYHELSSYTDVMLMPIEADRSLASMLGGGDYDGGEPIHSLVSTFAN
jgi:hypothetical protein